MIKKKIDISRYHNIPFVDLGSDFNGVDCFGIVRLFFKIEFDFEIRDFKYNANWVENGLDLICDGYKAVCEKIAAPTRYGIVGFRMPGYHVEHHLGVILYDLDCFLHAPLNQPSCCGKLSHPVWKRSISSFYRVKGF